MKQTENNKEKAAHAEQSDRWDVKVHMIAKNTRTCQHPRDVCEGLPRAYMIILYDNRSNNC